MSIIFIWKTGSTASTLTPVPLWGIANTSTTRTVKSSTNSPSIRPMTSIGTPARPCRSILSRASDEMWTVSELSIRFVLSWRDTHVNELIPRPKRLMQPRCAAFAGRRGAYRAGHSSAEAQAAAAEQCSESVHDCAGDCRVKRGRKDGKRAGGCGMVLRSRRVRGLWISPLEWVLLVGGSCWRLELIVS